MWRVLESSPWGCMMNAIENVKPINELDALALHYGTDKASHHHGYTKIYHEIFAPMRQSVRGVCEIGVGGKNYRGVVGSSLMMWRDYFPGAQIVGIDIDPAADGDYGKRIKVVIGDQTKKSTLDKALKELPSADIIIDDGSHINTLTIASFEYLFPKLNPGGIYVIEDTLCFSEMRLQNYRTQMEDFVISLVRGLETNGRILTKRNMADFEKIPADYVLNTLERWVEKVILCRGIYFIHKRAR